jgi:hypothetical protein
VGIVIKIWLSTLGIDVGMSPEEWSKRSNLIPPNEHLYIRISEETTDIS